MSTTLKLDFPIFVIVRINIHTVSPTRNGARKTFEKIFTSGSKKFSIQMKLFGSRLKIRIRSMREIRSSKFPFFRFWIGLQLQDCQLGSKAGKEEFLLRMSRSLRAASKYRFQLTWPNLMVSLTRKLKQGSLNYEDIVSIRE